MKNYEQHKLSPTIELLIFMLALQISVLVFPGSVLWHTIPTDYINTEDLMLRGVPTSLCVALHPIGLLIKDTLFPMTALSTHSPSCEDRLLQTETRKHRPTQWQSLLLPWQQENASGKPGCFTICTFLPLFPYIWAALNNILVVGPIKTNFKTEWSSTMHEVVWSLKRQQTLVVESPYTDFHPYFFPSRT